MTQNTSSAVMQQRSEPHDSLDDFPTPPWATRALIEHVLLRRIYPSCLTNDLRRMRCWEPCANRGFMYLALQEYFGDVLASDIFDYGMGYPQHDFLMPYPIKQQEKDRTAFDWLITNPPFRLAEQIIMHALSQTLQGVAILVRTSFLEGVDRYRKLFEKTPPTIVAQFSERVIMHKGILRDPEREYQDPKTGEWKKPSTATSYCWLVWAHHSEPQPTLWIPPCRKTLTYPGDYPAPPRDDRPLTLEDALKRSAHGSR